MIGLKRGMVKLEPHDAEWAEIYLKEEQALFQLLKGYAIDIQHVGSTSIPGICAKPIIDILIGVKDLSLFDAYIDAMEKNEYIYRKESGTKERLLFVKGGVADRTHHIHIVEWDGHEWKRHILFRDYLRAHKDMANEYMKLKEKLAMLYPMDRESYTNAKSSFIEDVLCKAGIVK